MRPKPWFITRIEGDDSKSKFGLRRKRDMMSYNSVFVDAVGDSVAEGGSAGFTEVVVVRHGETTWNASRIIQGHLESDLNETGRRQAAAVARYISEGPKLAAVYSSDLRRAAETAKIIADICGLPEIILDQSMRERHLGDIQGLTLCDAEKLKHEAYKALISGKKDQEIPGGGESLNQLRDRCVSGLKRIAGKHLGERIVVVTHGGALRELHKYAAPSNPVDRRIPNTSVNVLHISSDGTWTIQKWGDISHLNEIGVLKNAFGGDKTSG